MPACPPPFPVLVLIGSQSWKELFFLTSPEGEGEMEFPRILAWAADDAIFWAVSLRSQECWRHRWEMTTCSICFLTWQWSHFLMLRMSKLSPRGPQSLVHGPTEQMQIWKLPFLWTPNDFLVSSTLCLVKITYPCLKYVYTLSKRPYYAALPCYSSQLTPLLVSTSLITSSAQVIEAMGLGHLAGLCTNRLPKSFN